MLCLVGKILSDAGRLVASVCLARAVHRCCFVTLFKTVPMFYAHFCMYKIFHKEKNKQIPKRQIDNGSKFMAINMNERKLTNALFISSSLFSGLWLTLSTNDLMFVLLPMHFNRCSLISSELLLSNFKWSAGGLKLYQDINALCNIVKKISKMMLGLQSNKM